MTCPAPTVIRLPDIVSWPTRSAIATTTPRCVRRTRTPKFVKLHKGALHKGRPSFLYKLPIDNPPILWYNGTGRGRRLRPVFGLFAILRFLLHSAAILHLLPDFPKPILPQSPQLIAVADPPAHHTASPDPFRPASHTGSITRLPPVDMKKFLWYNIYRK